MNKNKITRISALLLAVLALLSACAGTPEQPGETEAVTTAAAPNPPLVLTENGALKYAIIRSDSASQDVIDTASALFRTIRDNTGRNPTYKEDFVMPGKEPDNESPEILIGSTTRRQSAEKLATLSSMDYYVGFSDDGLKFLIIGGSDPATVTALNVFSDMIDGKITADADLSLELPGLPCEYRHPYPGTPVQIAGHPISDYTVCYTYAETADGTQAARLLVDTLSAQCGVLLPSMKAGKKVPENGLEIVIGSTSHGISADLCRSVTGALEYSICEKNGVLYLSANNAWGLEGAARRLIDDYILQNADVPAGLLVKDTAAGEQSFALTEGANLRIMTNNVWNCDSNQPAWQAMGEDCSAKNRAKGFAAVYLAYLPDVVNFQEMTTLMVSEILKNMKAQGVNYSQLTFAPARKDMTCLIYNPETVTLIDSGHHIYTYGCDSDSKGYTWGYFRHNATGECFVSLSTHLWWKSEDAQAGSNEWRRRQSEEIVAVTKQLAEKYNCPVFAQGDLNMHTSATAFHTLTDGGLENCHSVATVRADNRRGYHSCSRDGFSPTPGSGTYVDTSLDHMLVRNREAGAEVLVFDHVIHDFYAKLSDHYPVYVDVKLGK